MSEIIEFAVIPLVLIGFPTPLTSLSPEGMIAFFGFVAVGFFLLGMIGAVLGSFLGMLLEEQGGSLTISLGRHRAVLLVAILSLLIGSSAVVAESLVSAEIQGAIQNASPDRSVVVLANQTLTWNVGVEKVWANFSISLNSRIEVYWKSSVNVSFHIMIYPKPLYIEEFVHSYQCGPTACDLQCGGTYCGYGRESLSEGSFPISPDTGARAGSCRCLVP